MRILWFNWRDIKHPESGGAEVLTHEVMRRLVLRGHEMTLFCPKVVGRQSEEVIDGVRIVRKGGKYTVYSKGRSYFKKYRDNYDFIVDEVNPRPFLNPKVLDGKPALLLFHQLIREEWKYEMPFPISYFCKIYENRWLMPYKQTLTLTVSESSKADLESIGFSNVKVIPMGISVKQLDKIKGKEKNPTVTFIGRLKRHKLPDHAIRAYMIIKKKIPSARMWIIGDGYMLNKLKLLGAEDITFFGRVNNDSKYDLLARSQLVLMPSIREGWGLIVSEANAMGTPVIAYNVNGLRDSVVHGTNGLLVTSNTPESLAKSALEVLTNRNVLENLSTKALEHSKQFDWDKTTDYVLTQIERITH